MSALVVGGGPAGLMAADVLSRAGVQVLLADAKPSVGRKFLMAGLSGLNLTKAEPSAAFEARFPDWVAPMIAAFGPDAVRVWAEGLGVPLFEGSTGRVFPVAMKAAPLLRAWLARLSGVGLEIRTRWRWEGFDAGASVFATPEGPARIEPQVTVLALGGASWPRLGSDGGWVPALERAGVAVASFRPANAGVRIDWSPAMSQFAGVPLKGISLRAGDRTSRGECVVTVAGLEGGGIYDVSAAVREGAALTLDLAPDRSHEAVVQRLAGQGSASLSNHLRKSLRLDPVKVALLREAVQPLPREPAALATLLQALPLRAEGLFPLAGAISSAGGITASAMTPNLELRTLPGVFACGEMLDWEAPTGGYLITGCLATGRWAGLAALRQVQ